MAKTDPSVIEKYQLALQKDPHSQVFAPLAEAYREQKMLKEAETILRNGMKRHPNFVGGLVTLAKILRDQGRPAEALPPLKKAAQLAPENILAQQLTAEVYLMLRQPKDALKAFKMVLFLNPASKIAQNAVNKLESLTADEYDEEVFEMTKLHKVNMGGGAMPAGSVYGGEVSDASLDYAEDTLIGPSSARRGTSPAGASSARALERMLSLIDAFIVRNDLEKAHLLLKDTILEFGDNAEIQRRMKSLQVRTSTEPNEALPLRPVGLDPLGELPSASIEAHPNAPLRAPLKSRDEQARDHKLKVLQEMLSRIDGYRQAVEL